MEPPCLQQVGHHHDRVIGRVVFLRIRYSQPDMRCVESSRRADDDPIVSAMFKTKIEAGTTVPTVPMATATVAQVSTAEPDGAEMI